MEYLIISFLLVALGMIIYQDLKYRHIHVGLPVVIFGILLFLNQDVFNLMDALKSFGFLIINFLVITVYFSIKRSKLLNPFKDHVGIGDLIFLIGVIPLFSFRNYVLFFITGMIFSLILYLVFMHKYTVKTIPLAGYLSLYITALMIPNVLLSTNLFYTFII